MSKPSHLLLAAALGLAVTSIQASDSCEWRAPGSAAYAGDVEAAVDAYTDIPAPTRERIKARMRSLSYDDMVVIRRDGIDGGAGYEPELRGLHLQGRVCGEVSRTSWHPEREERALAYCEDANCVVVSLIYRNVGRIVRKPGSVAGGAPGATGGELAFAAPAAGLPPLPAALEDPSPTAQALAEPANVSRIAATTDLPLAPAPPLLSLPPMTELVLPTFAPELPLPPEPAPPEVLPVAAVPPLPPALAVPEPASVLLWAAGLGAGAWWARRRRLATH